MDKANITWYAKQDSNAYQADTEFYAGTYTKEKNLSVDIQIWNNRWGISDVDDIKDAVLNFYFETIEDSALLKNCTISVNNSDQLTTVVKGTKGSVVLNKTLSGKKNDGNDDNTLNSENFINITFSFNAPNYILKENDIKNLYFDIISST